MKISLVAVAVAISMLAPGGSATPSPKFIEGIEGVPLSGPQGGIALPLPQTSYRCWSADKDNTMKVTRMQDCPMENPTIITAEGKGLPCANKDKTDSVYIFMIYTCPPGYTSDYEYDLNDKVVRLKSAKTGDMKRNTTNPEMANSDTIGASPINLTVVKAGTIGLNTIGLEKSN